MTRPSIFQNLVITSRLLREFELLESLFDPETAAKLVRDRRGEMGIRKCAIAIGISPATLSRVERLKDFDTKTMRLIFEWLRK